MPSSHTCASHVKAGLSIVVMGVAFAGSLAGQESLIGTTRLECQRIGGPHVSGTVRDLESNVGLGGATVTLLADRGPAARLVTARAEADGSYRFCGLALGIDYELSAEYDGTPASSRTVRPSDRPENLEIDLGDPAYVVLSLRDAQTDEPVLGASAQLLPLSIGGVSNEFGTVDLREVPPGEYRIRVDHIAFAGFEEAISVTGGRATELRVQLVPEVIDVEPLEVEITGRDPYLVTSGFYDRRATMEEAQFYTYWDVEPYARLQTFMSFSRNGFIDYRGWGQIFINLRPMRLLGYRNVDEMPFGKIRGIERIPCRQAPKEIERYLRAPSADCVVTLIWLGNRRVRDDQTPPPK